MNSPLNIDDAAYEKSNRKMRKDYTKETGKTLGSRQTSGTGKRRVSFACRFAGMAGAMKKPVIAYDIGGISEVIKDQVNGLLCPVGDIEGIANATILLHSDKLYADKLSQGGHKRTVRDFDSRVHVEKVLSLFKAL